MANEEKQVFNLEYTDVFGLAMNIAVSMRFDIDEFALRGVTEADIIAFESLYNEFISFPNDGFYLADVSISVNKKNEARTELEKILREITGIAAIKWGEGSPELKRFEMAKMTKQGDKVFLTMALLAIPVAEDFLAAMSEYGMTQAKIDELTAAVEAMRQAMEDVAKAAMTRELKTRERLEKANELYRISAKYSEMGKIIWQDRDYGRYKQYVIYKNAK